MPEKPKMILVTGAGGQLGETLQKYGKEAAGTEWIFLTSAVLDICDVAALRSVFERYKPDVCINCAAYTNVEKAETEADRAFEVNAEAVRSLALECKNHDTLLIHISTDYVFDGSKGSPYTPEDPTNPLNVYGKSKLAGEGYIREILDRFYIVRASWLYSREFGHNFYRTIKARAREGGTLKVVNDQVGCPTDAVNLSRFLLQLITGTKEYGVLHYCDGVAMSWYDFAREILKENGLSNEVVPVDSSYYRQEAKRPRYSVLQSHRAGFSSNII